MCPGSDTDEDQETAGSLEVRYLSRLLTAHLDSSKFLIEELMAFKGFIFTLKFPRPKSWFKI